MLKKQNIRKAIWLAIFFVAIFFVGTAAKADNGIVQCGRGQTMCTLCDLIAGLNNIIRYIEKIAVGVGILAFTLAGVMYVVSGGDSKQIGRAKDTMKNAGIGFVIIFAGWVIINTAISGLGAYSNLGMNITSWGQFDCSARVR